MVFGRFRYYKQGMRINKTSVQKSSAIVIGLVLLLVTGSVQAKGPIVKIEISGDGLAQPIEITDPAILDLYSIWFGPQITAGGVSGEQMIIDGAESPGRHGWFIDWSQGVVESPIGDLQRVEVRMYIGEGSRYYLFLYAIDEAKKAGYIFLPKWRGGMIVHGVELYWLRSHTRWDKVVMPMIKQWSTWPVKESADNGLSCTVGPAVLQKDGSIKFDLRNEAGKVTSRWHYQKSSPQYPVVRALVGEVEPEKEFMLSCWPARG